jgi:hypothetical protein
MAAKKTVTKDSEDLSESNLEKVIGLLEAEKPCTKKEACAILRITYNTTRLNTIIENYKAKKLRIAELKAQKAYTPATASEIEYSVTAYLAGSTVSSIAEDLYRSPSFVDNILKKTQTPRRSMGWSYTTPELIPEAARRDEFAEGQKVWSARYESMARIKYEVANKNYPSKVYAIYLEDEKWQQNAYQPAEELASLEHLTKYGIKIQ